MSYKYCKKCGKKNQYLGIEPKFCSFCGGNFSATSSKNISNSVEISEELNDFESDSNFVPNIRKLNYTVSPMQRKTFSAEEIFGPKQNEEEGTT
jgi:rRNA maturation endonuclease Nob1